MTMRLDHVIVLINDLEDWSARFAAAGFTVTDRPDIEGEPPQHRLICFADGSYLELIHVAPGDAHAPGWVERVRHLGDGYGLWSVNAPDAAAMAALLPAAAGMPVHEGGNVVAGLGPWKVRVVMPDEGEGLVQPFVVQDVEGPESRSPAGPARAHANGATGIAGLSLVVRDLAAAAAGLEPALGPAADAPATAWSSGAGLRFTVGSQWITLHVPAEDTSEAALLATRGAGIAAVVLTGVGQPSGPDDAASISGLAPIAVRMA